MAIEDLDLEFEDEEEEKKGDALDVDVDLTFSASPESPQAEAGGEVRKKPTPNPTPKARPTPNSNSNSNSNSKPNVANINDAKKARPVPQARPSSQVKPTPSQNYSEDVSELKAQVQALQDKIRLIEQQAEVKVAIAEAEKHFLVEYVSNAKVLDHQITQMLQRINAKAPGAKAEVQMIKKHLNEFVAKALPKKQEPK
ncbi:MAG: hypothetical protein CME65_05330 [Halobacteriovoraceae bacterium]|nr:hypothetical protein [Halobacteriovoraceae bacterium]|tara:strand:- start:4496 stop:5089 length:594 start_codon:yes stop_codon:yes gene_type:complete